VCAQSPHEALSKYTVERGGDEIVLHAHIGQPCDSGCGTVRMKRRQPVLGHELPTERMTPYGFKRADFATAKPGAAEDEKKRRDAVLGQGETVNTRPPTAIIEEEPPLIGNP
jgi:hypothetical protein